MERPFQMILVRNDDNENQTNAILIRSTNQKNQSNQKNRQNRQVKR